MCQMISKKAVTTRKPQQCFGCEAVPNAGTTMLAMKTRGDGKIYTLYLCARCEEARSRLDGGDTYSQGELRELWE